MQVGPGRLFVGSTQSFLQDSLPTLLRCNHSIQYDAAQGPQPQLVQHLRASAIRSAFDPEAEALHFQLSTALQAGEFPLHHPVFTAPSPRRILPGAPPAEGVTSQPLHPLAMDQRFRTEIAHLLVCTSPNSPWFRPPNCSPNKDTVLQATLG